MNEPSDEATYSISIRLRRVTVEYAYVNVPVTDEIIKPDGQGEGRIDVTLMTEKAVGMGRMAEVVWYPEERRIETHPVQKAPEPGESRHPA